MEVKNLKDILKQSKYTVALSGVGMLIESGYLALRDGEDSYDIEQKYGYSSEELFHASVLSTRTELFYDFYKNVLLKQAETPPGRCFYDLAELEKLGYIDSVITRRIYNLPERAGCKNVINLKGHLYDNYCPHCGRTYDVDYIIKSKKVPTCTKCKTPIRPKVTLFGEMIDNAVMTAAAEEVEKADVLLILGTHLNTPLCTMLTGYYSGTQMIVISQQEHFSDKAADYVINETVTVAMEALLKELNSESKENPLKVNKTTKEKTMEEIESRK